MRASWGHGLSFIKAAVVSDQLRGRVQETLNSYGTSISTTTMSKRFFDELGMPKPDYNLGISGGSHASMTAAMLVALEETLLKEKPDMVLLYGDTDYHACRRLGCRKDPHPDSSCGSGLSHAVFDEPGRGESRVCRSRFQPSVRGTQQCLANLREEGLEDRSQFVGDPMYDAFIRAREKACGMSHELVCFDGSVRDIPGDTTTSLAIGRKIPQTTTPCVRCWPQWKNSMRLRCIRSTPETGSACCGLCGQRSYESVVFCDPVGYYTSIACGAGCAQGGDRLRGASAGGLLCAEEVRDGASFRGDSGNHGVRAQYLGRRRSGIPSRKLFPSSSISIPSISLLATGMRGIAWCPACLHSAARRTRAAVRRSAILFMAIDEAKAAFLCYPAIRSIRSLGAAAGFVGVWVGDGGRDTMQFIDFEDSVRADRGGTCASASDEVLRSQRYIMGPQIAEMEEKLAAYAGTKYAFSCSSGTDALVIPLMAYGLAKDDAVFVPSFTFFASGESVTLAGGTPVFVDSDPESYNIAPEDLERAIGAVLDEGKLNPRGIIAVDLFGRLADYGPIEAIAEKTRPVRVGRCGTRFWGQQGGQACRQLRQHGGHIVFPCQAAWMLWRWRRHILPTTTTWPR